jgi:hypothetical protein
MRENQVQVHENYHLYDIIWRHRIGLIRPYVLQQGGSIFFTQLCDEIDVSYLLVPTEQKNILQRLLLCSMSLRRILSLIQACGESKLGVRGRTMTRASHLIHMRKLRLVSVSLSIILKAPNFTFLAGRQSAQIHGKHIGCDAVHLAKDKVTH